MSRVDKRVASLDAAVADIPDGASVMVGGFGAVGQPDALLDALARHGARNLTVIANNAGWSSDTGIPKLMARGQLARIVCSYPKGSAEFERLYRAGEIELELVPQGTLAERIRCAGAGIPAFYTRTGIGTRLAEGKRVEAFDGVPHLLEHALPADYALIEAWAADRWGNLTFRGSGRNFNCVMATAARCTVVQANRILPEDQCIDPNAVVTPGIFVDRVALFDRAAQEAAHGTDGETAA